MRPSALTFALCTFAFAAIITPAAVAADAETASPAAIVREMNLARQNPAQYAAFVEELRTCFQGNLLVRPGRIALRTKEGPRAFDEAIRFLRNASPQPPLTFSPGMSRAAADHCAEQAGGGMSHKGRGGSNTGDRINRYGTWSGTWGENLSCGRASAREIVMALIIDDGLRSRKHRTNIFSSSFRYAGAAVGSHATYRTICSIEFAGGYTERGQAGEETLVARNF
ncbi:MAG: CAP domain-containing protein [Chthoniobacterales bacterium]